MSFSNYEDWLLLIKSNIHLEVDNRLTFASPKMKNMLLNWPFEFGNLHSNEGTLAQELVYSQFQATYPLTLAVVYQSSSVISTFLKHGVSVWAKEINGNNIIHMLCYRYVAYSHRDKEQEFQKTFSVLKSLLPKKDLGFLLMDQNNCGQRPLELAGHLGLFGLFDEIFHTPGIYMEEFQRGMFTEQWFDVTEYEQIDIPNRETSPLLYVTLLDKENLKTPSMKAFFQKEHIKMWIDGKIKANYLALFIWFVRKVFFLTLLCLLEAFSMTLEEDAQKEKANEDASLNTNNTISSVYWTTP